MRCLPPLVAGLLALSSLLADEFPKPYDSETDLSAPHMDPAEAAAKFRVPPGFKVSVFAAEPEVMNPIAAAWDTRGRLWIAENYTYAERPKKFELALRDRVLIFHDRDGDGKPDERKVFLDDAQRLTGIEVGLGGVWLMCPPQLLFVPDRNGDDVPDGPAEAMLEGFTVPPENFHNFANGLHWGPDGWLYGRCGASAPGLVRRADAPNEYAVPLRGGIWRFHPRTKQFDALCHGTTNPWGHDWDANGEAFFINTVNGHLWHMIPGAHYRRPHTINANPLVYEPIEMHADHWHWDTGKDWTDSRKASGEHDRLGGGHAHVGMAIYNGDQWPAEYRGRLLTLNQHGRRMNVERLEREGSGYVARHEPDILQAADAWFRGVEVTVGPDGAVYLIDWNDTGECHEATGVHRNSGRIFKVTYGDPKPTPPVDLTKLDFDELYTLLIKSRDEWYARGARRELANRAFSNDRVYDDLFSNCFLKLRSLLSQSKHDEKEVLRWLWMENTLSHTTPTFEVGFGSSSEQVRTWTIQLTFDCVPLDSPLGIDRSGEFSIVRENFEQFVHWSEFKQLAISEQSGRVRLALASALQRLPADMRPELAAALLSHAEDADDHNLPEMIWYGLIPVAEQSPERLAPLAAEAKIPKVRQWIARRAGEVLAKRPHALNDLLAAVQAKPDDVRHDVVLGLVVGLAGQRKAKAPENWQAFAAGIKNPPADVAEALRTINVVFGDGRALDEVRRIALDGKADLEERRAALRSLIDAQAPDLREICQKLLKTRFLNTTALEGLTRFDDPAIGRELAASYKQFHHSERAAVIEALVSRPVFAEALLDQMAAGTIARGDLSAAQVRQIRAFDNPALTKRLIEVWGELRDSPQDKLQLAAKLKSDLTSERLASADASRGRALFVKSCTNCHRLFGAGGEVGPDLTGANRKNLDYLLENIVDPSAVVNKDFLVTVFTMADGRTVTGVVTSETDQTLAVQTAQQKVTLLKADIEERAASKLSLMPDGLLQPLDEGQIRDLFAYLMSETQKPLPPTIGNATGGP